MTDIDRKTQAVLDRGFTYSGVNVSLSLAAQVRYLGFGQLSSLLGTITVEASDDLSAPLVLATFLSIGPFCTAVNQYVRDVWEAHNALKTSIRAAATNAQVEAVVDTR